MSKHPLSHIREKYNLVLGSGSPRRKQLLTDLGLEFEVRKAETDEQYPEDLEPDRVAEFLAKQKFEALLPTLQSKELLITADTIVLFRNEILGKPGNAGEARRILKVLSGNTHKVITGVSIGHNNRSMSFSVQSSVHFQVLKSNELDFYIENSKPFDKAGSYGIQEWIGMIGVSRVEGCYYNIVGLPVHQLYQSFKRDW